MDKQARGQPKIQRFIQGGTLLSFGFALVSGCTLIRSIFIARGISVEDYGIASALLAVLALIRMTTAVAADKQILQDKDGGSPTFLSGAHSIAVAKGSLCALFVYLAAEPATLFFDQPALLPAFQLVAFAPLIAGFCHYDYRAFQRDGNHRGVVAVTAGPEIIVTLLVIPVLVILQDYRVMIFVCLGLPIAKLVVSHLVSKRSYRLTVNPRLMLKMLKFAWPLMLSGLMLFGIFQGDKFIVGHYFDVFVLGYYSLALTLFLLPGQILHRIYNSLILTQISQAYRGSNSVKDIENLLWGSLLILAGGYIYFCMSFGATILTLVFGEKYGAASAVIPWIVCMVAIRIIRIAPSILALALAQTKCELYANIARSVAIPIAIFSVISGFGLESVAAAGVFGEAMALIVGWRALKFDKAKQPSLRSTLPIAGLFFAALVLSTISVTASQSDAIFFATNILSVCIILLMCFMYRQQVHNYMVNIRS